MTGRGVVALVFLLGTMTVAAQNEAAGNAGSLDGPVYVGSVYVDRVRYATVQSAIDAACDGKTPGHVSIPPGTFTGPFTPTSNCAIEGAGMGITIIQAATLQDAAMVELKKLSHVALRGFTVDGACVWVGARCTAAGKSFDLIRLTNSSWVTIDDVEVRNMKGNGIDVAEGNAEVDIRNSVADRFGGALPNVGSVGFFVSAGNGAASSHVRFFNNVAHDGNLCFALFPSTAATNVTLDVVYDSNRAYACANDGFLVYSDGVGTYGAVRGLRYLNNQSYCNGWPAKGAGFSPNCTPGLLQTGPIASSSGVGFDLNSPVLDQPQIIGNRAHDNFYEGFDNTPQTATTVDTQGTTVNWVSGDAFNPAWKPGQGVHVGDANYLIAAVDGPRSTLTLTTPAGMQKGIHLMSPGYDRALFQGNYAYSNGHGNGNLSGHGFADISYGSTYSGNVAYLNNAAGFIDQLSSFVTHTGDKAMDNNRSNGPVHLGFYAQAALAPTYVGVTTDNSTEDNFQSTAILLDAQTTGGYVAAGALCNAKGCDPAQTVRDNGKGDTVYGRR
jgi:hypothetical protein